MEALEALNDTVSSPPASAVCPHCGAFAQQWVSQLYRLDDAEEDTQYLVRFWFVATCIACDSHSFWRGRRMQWPDSLTGPLPNPGLPEPIAAIYQEARQIASVSPRGAAALLRLCVQELCIHLGHSGKNLNSDIGKMVKAGLDDRIQQALDIVRVIGNNAVHPGQISLTDGTFQVETLFNLVNDITEDLISRPARLKANYATIPEGTRKAIEERNATARASRSEGKVSSDE